MQTNPFIASQLYSDARAVARPDPASPGNAASSTLFADIAANFIDTLRQGEDTARAAMAGRADAHSVVAALAASELAIETAVAVRDKVVEAYQEILRMPV